MADYDPARSTSRRLLTRLALQNRVRPTGEIVAHPARGTCMGNRGILHNDHKSLGTARWRHKHWVCCQLTFKSRHRQIMAPRQYTELFFLDEAVALAAGHRPCAECRRADYHRFRAAFAAGHLPVENAAEIDQHLHMARVTRTRRQVTHQANTATLPDGSFIALDGGSWLVRGPTLHRYTPGGYTVQRPRPTGEATVLTPLPTVATLAQGYRPQLHESAQS